MKKIILKTKKKEKRRNKMIENAVFQYFLGYDRNCLDYKELKIMGSNLNINILFHFEIPKPKSKTQQQQEEEKQSGKWSPTK